MGCPQKTLINFYQATIESILIGGILVWFGNLTEQDHRTQLRRVVKKTASKIIGTLPPQLQDITPPTAEGRQWGIMEDTSHPAHGLFSLLPSGKRLQSIRESQNKE